MIIWSPEGKFVNNTYDFCYGINEFNENLTSQGFIPSKEFRLTNLTILIIFQIHAILCVLWQYPYRHSPRIYKMRPFYLTIVMVIGVSALNLVIFGRNAFPLPCTTVFAPILATPTIGSALLVRLIVLLSEASLAKKIMLLNVATLRSDAAAMNNVVLHQERPSFSFFLRVLLNFGMNSKSFSKNVTARVINGAQSESPTHQSSHNTSKDIKVQNDLNIADPRYLFYVSLILVSPAFIAVIILFLKVDIFKTTCMVCPLFVEAAFAICFSLAFCVIFIVALLYQLRNETDHFGGIAEFKLLIVFLVIPVLVSVILLIVDPGDYTYHYVFQYDWIVGFALFNLLNISVLYPTYCARKDFARSLKQFLPNLKVSLEGNIQVKKKFEEFCSKNFILELLRFIEQVDAYKKTFPEMTQVERSTACLFILKNFIKSGAPFEINVDSIMRKRMLDVGEVTQDGRLLDKMIKKPGQNELVSKLHTLFDEAAAECYLLLTQGAWNRFLHKNPDIEASLRANATVQQVIQTSMQQEKHQSLVKVQSAEAVTRSISRTLSQNTMDRHLSSSNILKRSGSSIPVMRDGKALSIADEENVKILRSPSEVSVAVNSDNDLTYRKSSQNNNNGGGSKAYTNASSVSLNASSFKKSSFTDMMLAPSSGPDDYIVRIDE